MAYNVRILIGQVYKEYIQDYEELFLLHEQGKDQKRVIEFCKKYAGLFANVWDGLRLTEEDLNRDDLHSFCGWVARETYKRAKRFVRN